VSLAGKRGLVLATALLAVAALTACASGAHAGTSSARMGGLARSPVIPCGEKAGTSASGTVDGYRVVLGVVSVPPPVLRQAVRTKSARWPFWRKAGLAIHPTRKTVSVIVPQAWRKRVALTWGWDHPPANAVKFQPCPYGNLGWNGYAGGFYLSKRQECVPLIFKVGKRTKTVRFGFDKRCSRS
jgi:hypothetical protein